MGKSDKRRAGNKIDEQQTMGQSYLTGLQSQLAGQYGNYSNAMFGQTPSAVQNTFGWGTTTPQFSWPGTSYFPGSTTGNNNPYGSAIGGPNQGERTRPPGSPPIGTATGGSNYPPIGGGGTGPSIGGTGTGVFGEAQFRQMFPGNNLSSDQLWAARDQLAKQGIQVLTNAEGVHGKIKLPNGQIVDVIQGAGSGVNRPQWLTGNAPMGTGASGGILGQTQADYGNLMKQYQGWADTGGLSEQDKANLRQRAVSPIRSMYERGTQDLARQRTLQGGYSPGQTTALTRMNRNLGQGMSDVTGNAEANITDMMLKGKQFGMGGMSGMYGQTPGMLSTVGNQMLAGMGQQLQAGGLQNDLSQALMRAQIGQGEMKGFPWAQTLKTIAALAAAYPTGGASLAMTPAFTGAGFAGGGMV